MESAPHEAGASGPKGKGTVYDRRGGGDASRSWVHSSPGGAHSRQCNAAGTSGEGTVRLRAVASVLAVPLGTSPNLSVPRDAPVKHRGCNSEPADGFVGMKGLNI